MDANAFIGEFAAFWVGVMVGCQFVVFVQGCKADDRWEKRQNNRWRVYDWENEEVREIR